MILILGIVIALVAWALHLMQEAIDQKEFAFMLAGLLVASSAAALVGVYFLMATSLNCLFEMSHHDVTMLSDEAFTWVLPLDDDVTVLPPS
jgi:hypothetical protein